MRHIMYAAVALLGLATVALADEAGVKATDAWARATTASAKTGGVFLTLSADDVTDRLVSASSPAAKIVELHETVNDGGVMRMRPVERLVVEDGQKVVLKPGGLHIMLMGLTRPLNRGETFPITLTFEKSPPVTATVTVQSAGASGPAHSH